LPGTDTDYSALADSEKVVKQEEYVDSLVPEPGKRLLGEGAFGITEQNHLIFPDRKIDPTKDRDGALFRNGVATTLVWFGHSP